MSLTSFGTNIEAQRKRVRWYNRESSAEVIREGQPVCYMFDTTNNVLGYDKGAGGDGEEQTTPDTTAEGNQNEGKFMIVEKVEIDNQDWFAGVVASGGWVGKSVAATSYEWIEIFTPNGAVVPVRAAVKCVTGRTILAITDDELALVNPVDTVADFETTSNDPTAGSSDGRPVAIAEETRALSNVSSVAITAFSDYSATVAGTVRATCTHGLPDDTYGIKISGTDDYDGVHTITYIDASYFYFTGTFTATDTGTMSKNVDIVLARLCPQEFMHQGGQTDYEMQIAAGTANVAINRSMLKFLQTAGHCQALHYRAFLAGDGTTIGDGQRGVFRFETFVAGAAVTDKHIHCLSAHLECGGSTTGGGQMSALQLTVRSKNVNPDMSTCGKLSAIHVEWHMRKTDTGTLDNPPINSQILYVNSDNTASLPDNFMFVETFGGIASYASTATPAESTGDLMIPIVVNGFHYYLVGFLNDGLA